MFYILITFTAPATADEQTAAKTLPAADDAWLDVWHSKFSDSMDFTAQQLDEFFALEGSDNHKDARADPIRRSTMCAIVV